MKKIIVLLDFDDTLAMPIDSLIILNEGLINKLSQLQQIYGENIEFVCATSYAPQLIIRIINGHGVTKDNLSQTKFRLNIINALNKKGIHAPLVVTCSPRVNRTYPKHDYGNDLLALEQMALDLTGRDVKELQTIISTIMSLQPEAIVKNKNYKRKDKIGEFLRKYVILLKKENEALSQKPSFVFGGINTSELPEQNTVLETKAEMLLYVLQQKCSDPTNEYKVIFVDDKESIIKRMQSLKNQLPDHIQLETVKVPVEEVFFDRNYDNLLEDFTFKLLNDKKNSDHIQYEIEPASDNIIDRNNNIALEEDFTSEQVKDNIEILPLNTVSTLFQFNQILHKLNPPQECISTSKWKEYFLEDGTITDNIQDTIHWIDLTIEKLNKFNDSNYQHENNSLKNWVADAVIQLEERKKNFQNNYRIHNIIKNTYHKSNDREDHNKFNERYNAVYKKHQQIFITLQDKNEATILYTLDKYFENSVYRKLANYLDKELFNRETTRSPLSVHKVSLATEAKSAAEALLKYMEDSSDLISPDDLKTLNKSIALHRIYNDYLREKASSALRPAT